MAACGADPLAGPLWELYIQVETVNVSRDVFYLVYCVAGGKFDLLSVDFAV